ncbi:MAG: hypothetical protein LBG58_03420 [Planctomycetaceae bacterium]|jgi:hypothetical protein|nr:hypothetical protein [Planctomycetaceae bacterium]
MKKIILVGLSVVTCLIICVVVIYAHTQISNSPSVPPVEVNARFASADKNGDGVLSKEEFATYLVKIKQVKSAEKGTVKLCPETGLPCEHDDANTSDCCNNSDKNVAKNADGEKSCCSEGKNAETVAVKLSQESEAKGGCCGGKDKAKTADSKNANGEKSCCSEGKNAETVAVKLSQESEAKSGCCGGKGKEAKNETNTAVESENPVAAEKTETETELKTPEVSETNSNDKQ